MSTTLFAPALGMGTFRLKDQLAYDSVAMALQAGYRHIDTAQIYGNEEQVGLALADSGIARSEIFLTTKVWLSNLSADRFIASVKESLQKLQTDQVDLLLIHWPDSSNAVAMQDYLRELKQAKTQGLTKAIGVSNFTIAQLQQAIEILGPGEIVTNQVEVHPYLQNRKLLAFMQQQGITPTAYMPLAVGKVFADPVLQEMSARTGHSIAQLVLRWVLDQGMVTIPMSTQAKNLADNFGALSVTLAAEDKALIAGLDAGERIANPDFAPAWD
ncbi:2,5-didehydrogluconate reductase DkgB [Rheinheimera sp.]|uniref:2,5-didehydrogluconate reductase DkgB n=1 Tax=Rheinheimera sp. TaxID=1869214 RepID=UPI00307D4D6D